MRRQGPGGGIPPIHQEISRSLDSFISSHLPRGGRSGWAGAGHIATDLTSRGDLTTHFSVCDGAESVFKPCSLHHGSRWPPWAEGAVRGYTAGFFMERKVPGQKVKLK